MLNIFARVDGRLRVNVFARVDGQLRVRNQFLGPSKGLASGNRSSKRKGSRGTGEVVALLGPLRGWDWISCAAVALLGVSRGAACDGSSTAVVRNIAWSSAAGIESLGRVIPAACTDFFCGKQKSQPTQRGIEETRSYQLSICLTVDTIHRDTQRLIGAALDATTSCLTAFLWRMWRRVMEVFGP